MFRGLRGIIDAIGDAIEGAAERVGGVLGSVIDSIAGNAVDVSDRAAEHEETAEEIELDLDDLLDESDDDDLDDEDSDELQEEIEAAERELEEQSEALENALDEAEGLAEEAEALEDEAEGETGGRTLSDDLLEELAVNAIEADLVDDDYVSLIEGLEGSQEDIDYGLIDVFYPIEENYRLLASEIVISALESDPILTWDETADLLRDENIPPRMISTAFDEYFEALPQTENEGDENDPCGCEGEEDESILDTPYGLECLEYRKTAVTCEEAQEWVFVVTGGVIIRNTTVEGECAYDLYAPRGSDCAPEDDQDVETADDPVTATDFPF